MAEPEPPQDSDDAYNPSEVEATRARMQGGGVGQKDLDRQRDPTRGPPPDQSGEAGTPNPPAS